MSYRTFLFMFIIYNVFPSLVFGNNNSKFIKRTDGNLRLIGGNNFNEGNVEILRFGRWGAVCDKTWTINEAKVVCRQLGFSNLDKVQYTNSGKFGKTKSNNIKNIYPFQLNIFIFIGRVILAIEC